MPMRTLSSLRMTFGSITRCKVSSVDVFVGVTGKIAVQTPFNSVESLNRGIQGRFMTF